jgi:hypothetical protein
MNQKIQGVFLLYMGAWWHSVNQLEFQCAATRSIHGQKDDSD